MRMIDEDEIDLKEKPKNTKYTKKITSKCWQRTFPTLPLLGTADSETGRVVTYLVLNMISVC